MKVIFRKGSFTSLMDILVQILTFSRYCHCEILFTNGEAYSSSPLDKGTRFKNISEEEIQTNWDVIDLDWITQEQEETIYKFCKEELGCGYDWKNLLLGWIFTPVNSINNWFCSELVFALIRPYTLFIQDRWYTPKQLLDSINQEILWRKCI